MIGPARTLTAAALALLVPLSACDTTAPDEAATVQLTAPATELAVGASLQIAAAVLNRTGALMSSQVQWTSLDPAVASVSGGGLVTGLTGGTARIRATAGSATATMSLTVNPPSCSTASISGGLAMGQTVTGTLSVNDCLFLGMNQADGYTFSVSQRTFVRFHLESSQFEPGLVLTDMSLNPFTGDGGYGSVARIAIQLEPGSYIVWATTFGNRGTGSYTLSASAATPCTGSTTLGSVAIGQTVSTTLAATNCVLPHGYEGAGWRLSLSEGATLRVTARSSAFLPLVALTDLNLDGLGLGWPTDSASVATFVQNVPPGEYIVWASSVYGGVGAVSVTIDERRMPSCNAGGGTIAVGATVNGAITGSSCQLEGGFLAEPWRVTLTEPATLLIDMTSSHIDTFLILADADGRILAMDDDGGLGTNSRLLAAVQAGTYTVWATTYNPGATGPYLLSVHRVSGGTAAPRLTPGAGGGGAVEPQRASKLSWDALRRAKGRRPDLRQ